ncbi:MAG: M23 family metallopeptidase [Bacteroidales bacterium]|jgi:hypothetical protein|nr:M23 family metallopeptidase [Bacteroidales bacterium]
MPKQLKNKRRKFFRKLKHTYRLVFFNDNNFEEVWHVRFTLINVLSTIGTVFILLVAGSIALVMFTPMREWVPGYPTQAMRNQLMENLLRLDSLEYEMQIRDSYFRTVNAIVLGREPEMTIPDADVSSGYTHITFTRSEEDSLLRLRVEEEEQFNFMTHPSDFQEETSILKTHFFKPVEGIVTGKFNIKSNHFGTDLAAHPNEVVKSILDGTVIMSVWTVETGYVIEVQHASNLLSIYKHNASLLKSVGDRVKAGDAIAIIGNSGELTTGPHLHLEIWNNGKPVNPEDYIVF